MTKNDKNLKKYESILCPVKQKPESFRDVKYYETQNILLKFNRDKGIFSRRLVDILGDLLDPETFLKMTAKQKKKYYEQLYSVFAKETTWKTLVKKTQHKGALFDNFFINDKASFQILFKKTFYVPLSEAKNKHKSKKYAVTKAHFLCNLIYDLLVSSDVVRLKSGHNSADKEKLINEVLNEINPGFLFYEIVKICIFKAYEYSVTNSVSSTDFEDKSEKNYNFLKVRKQSLEYPLSDLIYKNMTCDILRKLVDKNYCVFQQNHNINNIDDLMSKGATDFDNYIMNVFKYSEKEKYNEFNQVCLILSNFLITTLSETDVIIDTFAERDLKKRNKKHNVIVFNHKLDTVLLPNDHIPRIIKPEKLKNSDDLKFLVTPVRWGASNVIASDVAIESLDIANQKRFKVNVTFLNILKRVKRESKKHPDVITDKHFDNIVLKYGSLKNSFLNNEVNNLLYGDLSAAMRNIRRNKNADHEFDLDFSNPGIQMKMCGISWIERTNYVYMNKLKRDVIVANNKRQLLISNIEIADYFKGYPLYYDMILCFRLRMYPLQFMLSRTSGYLRNLLVNFESKKIDEKGIYYMLEAYCSVDKELLNLFYAEFGFEGRKKKKNLLADIKRFFSKNKLNGMVLDKPLYFALLEEELENILYNGNRKTSIELEIDQVASGPTIISIITGNRILGEKCNLFGGNGESIYEYIMTNVSSYLIKIIRKKREGYNYKKCKAFDFIITNRKIHKYCLMCYFYNQGRDGRMKKLVDEFANKYGSSPTTDEFFILSLFSGNYHDLINTLFPKLNIQLEILNKAVKISLTKNPRVSVGTLDGCIVEWEFDSVEDKKLNFYDAGKRKHMQSTYKIRSDCDKAIKDLEKRHMRNFMPNFVHSIDATIMRMFILKVFKKTKYRINHLHDCVMIPPVFVDDFHDIVTTMYCSDQFRTMASDLLFKRFIDNSVSPEKEELLDLKDQFLNNMDDDFLITKKTFDSRKCYKFETG